jgi:EmrB/QacA subfamily drug resistance transporter
MSDNAIGESRQVHLGAVAASICIGAVLLPISLTGASVALPDIASDLHANLAPVQWVVNGYDLTFAAFMLAVGSLADRVGRRRVFTAGLLTFLVCSLISALAPNILVLDIARAVAGFGATGVLTGGSALLAQNFEGQARAKVFAALGTAFGLGIAFGPVLSGAEIGLFGWRGVFLSHAVVGVIVLAVFRAVVPESRSEIGGRIDWLGTVLFTGALSLFILALIEGPQWGWGSPVTITVLVVFAVLLVAFPVVESRQESAMFDVALFRNGRFVGISLVPVVLGFGFTGILVLLPSYFASVDGSSAARSGLVLMLLTVPTLVLPAVGGWATKYLSTRTILAISLLLSAAGAAWLTVIAPHAAILTLAGPLIVIGAGFGFSLGILDGAAVSTVETSRAGMAAGMFNTMRLAGEVIAIAAMGSLIITLTQSKVADGISRFAGVYPGSADGLANSLARGDLPSVGAQVPAFDRSSFVSFAAGGYTDAFHIMSWAVAAFCAVAAVAVFALVGRPEPIAEARVAEVGFEEAQPVGTGAIAG